MKRNKAVLIFVLLIFLSGCSIVEKFREPKDVLLIDLYVLFDRGLDSEAFDFANQNAWDTVSSYMFETLKTRLQRINFKNIVYINNQDEYIPAENNYLLKINFCDYYIAIRHKTIDVDYMLIHKTNVLIDSVASTPYVTLKANVESGIAPLTTHFSVSTSIPDSVVSYTMSFEGDGVADYTGPTFDDVSFTYTAEGIYYPTVTVLDDQSNVYTDSIVVMVLNQTEVDTLLQAKWSAMKTALVNQDVSTALNYFTDEAQGLYNDMFVALYDQLPQIAQDMQSIELIYSDGNMAKYRMRQDEIYGGQLVEFTYYIYFVMDVDGIWKINSF